MIIDSLDTISKLDLDLSIIRMYIDEDAMKLYEKVIDTIFEDNNVELIEYLINYLTFHNLSVIAEWLMEKYRSAYTVGPLVA